MRSVALIAAVLMLAAVALVVAGINTAPLSRTCAPGMDQGACDGAVSAVLRRGLPSTHPLILAVHVEPGAAPGPQDLGHRATVAFDLLGVPGPTSVELYFDRGAHWGGALDRDEGEIAAWTLAPLAIVSLLSVVLLGLAWRRRSTATE